jgi:RTX calcium-binding nonapeptide repeat (4 copies)
MQAPRLGFRALLVILVGVAIMTPAAPAYAVADRGCNITGTPRADTLIGTRQTDIMCGLYGNDTLRAGRRADIIYSGQGNDRLRGGRGRDTFFGGRGDDRLNSADGVTGNDTVYGRLGFDVCLVDRRDIVTGCEKVLRSK